MKKLPKKSIIGQNSGTNILFVAHKSKYTKRLYLRANPKSKQNDPLPVVFCVTINRQKFRLTLDIKLKPSEFDSESFEVKLPGEKERSHTYTRILASYLAKAENIFTRAMLLDKPLTIQSFKAQWKAFGNRASFIQFMEDEIAALKLSRKPSTVIVYNTVKNDLREFKPGLLFSELDPSFVQLYDRHLVALKINSNTRMKYHKTLKTFCNIALSRNLIFEDPYKIQQIKRIKSTRTHISKESLNKLAALYAEKSLPDSKQAVLRAYLFSCYTGIRFSDVCLLTESNLIDSTICFTPVKTQSENIVVKMKLPELAIKLINRKGKLIPCVSEAKTNEALKYIANFLKLPENLTFHTARHTFATMFILSGGGVETLQLLMGHSKIETTMIYVQLVNETKAQEIQLKSFEKFISTN